MIDDINVGHIMGEFEQQLKHEIEMEWEQLTTSMKGVKDGSVLKDGCLKSL